MGTVANPAVIIIIKKAIKSKFADKRNSILPNRTTASIKLVTRNTLKYFHAYVFLLWESDFFAVSKSGP